MSWCTLSSEMATSKPVPPSAGSPDTVVGEEDLRVFRDYDRYEEILMRQRIGKATGKKAGKR